MFGIYTVLKQKGEEVTARYRSGRISRNLHTASLPCRYTFFCIFNGDIIPSLARCRTKTLRFCLQ